MHLADAFIQSDLQLHSGYTFLISICVPWESNPQPFALLMQCHWNTQEHGKLIQNLRICAFIKKSSPLKLILQDFPNFPDTNSRH